MIDFYDGQITDLLPYNIKEDAAVQAISYALREGTRLLYGYAQRCYAYCSIDTMPDEILDLMAVELRTQYYSDSFDIETKRALVSNTLLWYMTAGTPAAVEELVAVVFGEGEVSEWYEYGGEPYWFKITTNATFSEGMIDYFTEMIERVKNTRSHLGAIEIHRTVELTVYAGCGVLSMYKSPMIVESFEATWETTQTINTGVGGLPSYTPEAIFERLTETAKVPASEIFAGVGQHTREIRPEIIKEE